MNETFSSHKRDEVDAKTFFAITPHKIFNDFIQSVKNESPSTRRATFQFTLYAMVETTNTHWESVEAVLNIESLREVSYFVYRKTCPP